MKAIARDIFQHLSRAITHVLFLCKACFMRLCHSYIKFDLITTHIPISAQSSNSIVFRLYTSSVLFVYFFIKAYAVGTRQCNSNGSPTYKKYAFMM